MLYESVFVNPFVGLGGIMRIKDGIRFFLGVVLLLCLGSLALSVYLLEAGITSAYSIEFF